MDKKKQHVRVRGSEWGGGRVRWDGSGVDDSGKGMQVRVKGSEWG